MKYPLLIVIIFILLIFLPWFNISETLSSGDWPYLYRENIKQFNVFDTPYLWVDPYYRLTAKIGVEFFSLSWEFVEKLFWFYPFIIISIISSWTFVSFCLKSIVKKTQLIFILIGSLIYTTNTYILMIVGGGQMGIAMAYAMAPFVLVKLLELLSPSSFLSRKIKDQKSKIKNVTITSIVLSVQLMFDPRIFLLTFFAVFLYLIFQGIFEKRLEIVISAQVISMVAISIVLNLFWLIPNISFYKDQYNVATNAFEINFLSFAQFSNAFSLLHPNWPENIFGKVYFMRAEFLLLPIVAFTSLLFINAKHLQTSFIKKSKRKSQSLKLPFNFIQGKQLKAQNFKNSLMEQSGSRIILFFCFLSLLGAFFAKGTNPPFGEIYIRLLSLPGFMLFRDPTKFYVLVALSYSVLIPISLVKISERMPGEKVKYSIVAVFFLLLWFLLIRLALFGRLSGTFKTREVPSEYIVLKEFIKNDYTASSILWIPARQRFGFYSKLHPALDAQDLLGTINSGSLINELKKDKTRLSLKDEKIKYIILPYDSEKELFLKGYTYEPKLRNDVEKTLNSLSWLKKDKMFGSILIYEIKP